MLTIATGKEVALLLFHTPTKYGSDRFRQIFIDYWERWRYYRRKALPADRRAYVRVSPTLVRECVPERFLPWRCLKNMPAVDCR